MKLYYRQTTIIDNIRTGKDARKERGNLSLQSVANKVGISKMYLSDLERGKRNWTEELFNKVKQSLAQSMQEARRKK